MSEVSGSSTDLPGHEQVVCTLFEGDHHFGAAALINSLVNRGFCGLFWIGFRGLLPPWTECLTRGADGLFAVGNARLGFEAITGSRHFGQYKSEFLLSLVDRGVARNYLWYFDPDVTVGCEWSFFERWVRFGVCLVQDMRNIMPSRHPFRCEWRALARQAGWREPVQEHDHYYNSGFVGMGVVHRAFLVRWMDAVRLANATGVQPGDFQKRGLPQLFARVDQDSLNIAAMYAGVPFSTMGPEGMGFTPGWNAMYHADGRFKPWRKNFLLSALRGSPPTSADKQFLACAAGPIQAYSPAALKWLRARCTAAALLGRFYSRN
jgi:hypothetical protein